jgi:hypothetical protein
MAPRGADASSQVHPVTAYMEHSELGYRSPLAFEHLPAAT